LIKDFAARAPKIAVLGLNPHAGENGLLGSEENDIIIPAIKAAFEEGILAFGPYPSDGFFGSDNFTKFDAVLAMYHDQGLTPFKTLSFGTGVNYTAGLPIVRTSPDHGTGYDIAGKNVANETSFRNAIYLAHDIFFNRKLFREINQNPLQTKEIKERES
jgi:4-hydroxythreonine-4-phosphate dehydrogenase